MTDFPVTHSIISTRALLTYTQHSYEVGEVIDCRFLNHGLNDTYLLQTLTSKYILRVYRLGWRSLSDLLYELDMLLHLHRKEVPVSFPLVKKTINSPLPAHNFASSVSLN